MQRDHWYSVSRRYDRLESAESIGRIAAIRALRRFGREENQNHARAGDF